MEIQKIITLEELHAIAQKILSHCVEKSNETNTATVIGLTGDLGVGKTAFTKALARLLKIEHEITSPTFVIMKSYAIPENKKYTHLIHIDAYRIESDDEMRVLRLQEILNDSTKLVCIEWPEKIQSILPSDTHNITLALNTDGSRDISYDI